MKDLHFARKDFRVDWFSGTGGGGQHRYACATHHAGGPAACGNGLTVPRVIAEQRLLEPVMRDLLSPEAITEGVRQLRAAKIETERARDDGRELRELQRLVREGVLSAEVAAPAMAEARRRTETVSQVWPTPAAWRTAVEQMREILAGPDVAAARDCLRELIGDVRCIPAGDHVIAEMTARRVLLATGTGPGRWDGSGGLLWTRIPLPISTR